MKLNFILRAVQVVGVVMIGFYFLHEASAEPFVCVRAPMSEGLEPILWRPRCETLHNVQTGLKAVSLIMESASLGSACTVVGAPATVWLQGGAVGFETLELVVGELPCDSASEERQVKALAKEVVCRELEALGITCASLK